MKQRGEPIHYRVGEPMPGTKWVVRGKLGEGGMGIVLRRRQGRLPPGRHEGAPSALRENPRARRQVPRRSQAHRHAPAPEHRPSPRLRSAARTARRSWSWSGCAAAPCAPRCARRPQHGRTWTPENTYAVAAHVAQGLARAHAHVPSIVHRDIKPENIFLHRPEGTRRIRRQGHGLRRRRRRRRRRSEPRRHPPLHGPRAGARRSRFAPDRSVRPRARRLRDAHRRLALGRRRCATSPPSPTPTCTSPATPLRLLPWLPVPDRRGHPQGPVQGPRPAPRQRARPALRAPCPATRRPGRAPGIAETHSTDPMVGTIADGYPRLRDEAAPVAPRAWRSWEGAAADALTAGSAGRGARFPAGRKRAEPPKTSRERRNPAWPTARGRRQHRTSDPGRSAMNPPLRHPAGAKASRDTRPAALRAAPWTRAKRRIHRGLPARYRGGCRLAAALGASLRTARRAPDADHPPDRRGASSGSRRRRPPPDPRACRRTPPSCLPRSLPPQGARPQASRWTLPGLPRVPPGRADPRPLLVLLHGDNETASSMFDAWVPAAEARAVGFSPSRARGPEAAPTTAGGSGTATRVTCSSRSAAFRSPSASTPSACGSSAGRAARRTSATAPKRSSVPSLPS